MSILIRLKGRIGTMSLRKFSLRETGDGVSASGFCLSVLYSFCIVDSSPVAAS